MKSYHISSCFGSIFPLLAVLLLYQSPIHAQVLDTSRIATKYTQHIVPATFEVVFSQKEDKKNFKKLRAYFFEQTDKIERLNAELNGYTRNKYQDTTRVLQAIDDIGKWIKKAGNSKKAQVPRHKYNLYQYYQSQDESYLWFNGENQSSDTVSTEELSDLREHLIEKAKGLSEKLVEYGRLVSNLAVLEQDLEECERTIDEALRPESEDQWFRTKMSVLFAALIGVLLFVFFFLIFKRGGQDIAKNLLSALGLQFITLFVLIIAIILFGILDILKGSELAAILAGISGYILGSKTNAQSATSDNV